MNDEMPEFTLADFETASYALALLAMNTEEGTPYYERATEALEKFRRMARIAEDMKHETVKC